jgi:hypothetical protein
MDEGEEEKEARFYVWNDKYLTNDFEAKKEMTDVFGATENRNIPTNRKLIKEQ